MTTQAFPANATNLHLGAAADTITGTMSVLMRTNKYYTDGSLKQTGTTYTVTREWGKLAVESGWASDASGVLPALGQPSNNALFGAGPIQVSSALTITPTNANTYNGATLEVTTALTITISQHLPQGFAVAIIPPASGNLTIASDGVVLLNGATTSLTRAFSANPLVAVIKRGSANASFVVSGV